MQENRSDSSGFRPLRLALPVVMAALLLGSTGCAVRTIEDLEAASMEADQQRHFRDLVQHVHRSVRAMHSIFGPLGLAGRSGLSMGSVTLSMDVRHAQDEDGNLAALLTADDADSQSVEDRVVMTIAPVSGAETDAEVHSLSEPYRGYQPCHLSSPGIEGGAGDDRLDLLLVRASMMALDAWLCVADEVGSGTVALEALTITLTVDASQDESGGMQLTLGAYSVGETLDFTTDHAATVEFTFSRLSSP